MRACWIVWVEYGVKTALVWAGIELIFFRAECILLCFGFASKPALIMQGRPGHHQAVLTPHQGLLFLRLPGCQQGEQDYKKPGQLATDGCRDGSYHVVPCSKSWGKDGGEKHIFSGKLQILYFALLSHAAFSLPFWSSSPPCWVKASERLPAVSCPLALCATAAQNFAPVISKQTCLSMDRDCSMHCCLVLCCSF